MRFGLPWWVGAGPATEGIETVAELGYDLVEISLDEPWPSGLSGPELRDAANDAGIAIGFHAPWRTQSIAHPRSVLARAAATVAQECIDLAMGTKAEYVVFHVDAADFGGFPVRSAIEQGLKTGRQTLEHLATSSGRELSLFVENTSSPLGTPDEVAAFLDELPGVGFCFDPGHAVLSVEAGTQGAQADPEAWFAKLGRRLSLVHLMDHRATPTGTVDHLVPGAGDAPVRETLQAALDTGCERFVIEAFYRDAKRSDVTRRDLREARRALVEAERSV